MGVKLKKQKLAHLKTSYLYMYSHDIYHMQSSKQSTPPPPKKTNQKKKKKEKEKDQQQKTNVGNVIVYSLHCT